jgi:hypothetical protein
VLRQFKLKRWAELKLKRWAERFPPRLRMDTVQCGGEPLPLMEKRRRRILSLSVRVLGLPGQEPNLNLVSAENVDVADANKLIIANVVATIAIATTPAATAARGHEIEFVIRQFDRVSEIGHILHVGLLSVCDISGGIFAVTAATLSLAARHQSGCTSAKTFLCVTAGACFSISFSFLFFIRFCVFGFSFFSCQSGKRCRIERRRQHFHRRDALGECLPQTSS